MVSRRLGSRTARQARVRAFVRASDVQGSENHQDEFFKPFEHAGATDQNGTAWLDRTTYFETVPTTALDMALWMESDRMGHLLGAIDQAPLDEQRGMVQNEKRQGDNQPYGRVFEYLEAYSFPANHPYHHSLPGAYETAAAVLKAMADIEVYDRPDNYVQTLKSRIEAQTDAEVRAAAEQVIEADALTFVIVGDLATIEKPIRALELGEVKVIDVDGTAAHIGVPGAEGKVSAARTPRRPC